MYTYETSATDGRSYQREGVAFTMRVEYDTICVRGARPVPITLRFTRHGPLPRNAPVHGTLADAARDSVMAWNGVLSTQSVGAAIYATWERTLSASVATATLPTRVRAILRTVPLSRVVDWLESADTVLGMRPVQTRDSLISQSFDDAIVALTTKLGPDTARWQYGQALFHHVRIAHPLDGAVTDSLRAWLSPGPVARGGYANTVNATGNADNQTAGASLRVVFDLANWDRATVTNTPGQSGDPRSPHYRDLFAPWTQGRYTPLPFSRAAVLQRTETVEHLRP